MNASRVLVTLFFVVLLSFIAFAAIYGKRFADPGNDQANSQGMKTAPAIHDPETLWKTRCGTCHTYKRGQERFKGEEWKGIVETMQQKPGSGISPQEAAKIYAYLYEKTTGKKPPHE